MNTKKNIAVLGAGISGLATAHWLEKENYGVTIFEAHSDAGGAMITENEDGFLIDYGPNSGLETTPLIRQIAEEVGILDQMIYANEQSNKRYILRNGELHALPTSLPAFFKTKLFSPKAKLRLMKEPFVGKSEDGYYQSIAEFVKRRLGQEFLDYAINPFVSGVFAGDAEKLSVKSAFPKLYRLEELYGGLIKGMIKGAKERKARNEDSKQNAKMFSFINGMQTFPKSIAAKLKGSINYNSVIDKIEKSGSGYKIIFTKDGIRQTAEYDLILSTIPAHVASKVLGEIDTELTKHLEALYYPPVMVLYLGFDIKDINRPLDGFGYLIPSKENRKFLGAIWSSTIFPNRAKEGKASFTIFVGGARSPHLFEMDKQKLIDEVMKQFKEITNVTADPVLMKEKLWRQAIPQYNIGYIEHERYFEKFENENPGLFLSGNYRGGISVGDCIKNSRVTADRIIGNNQI
ncbi:MAG: protoporphyrinogen oxidase [Melioribacteraceae bacterium]|nr:protoporphyrinogen oxidase [Melioribacteraceae bacterium]MCF8355893.1 protoporphyrinogen oxidase [Melioribacteraceae bacterium]MCF8395198.1 protoporphyrinogen oxidase [Melioribacteraceae bacterium]MCF8420672.1 protoporphyrinogen oxidase [Melioribacteraceae bacterium]